MQTTITIHAAPYSNIFIGNSAGDVRREDPSLAARMLDRIQNMSPARASVAMAGVCLAAYLSTRLANLIGDAEHERQLYDAYMQGANDGFEEGYAVGFDDATRGDGYAGRGAIAYVKTCVQSSASALFNRLLT